MILKVGDVYSTSKCGDIVITDYISAKEAYIKEVAEKYKGQIDHRVYESLMNWKIEITD